MKKKGERLSRSDLGRVMAGLEQLDGSDPRARRRRVAVLLNVAAELVERGNVIPQRSRYAFFVAWSLRALSNKFDPRLRRPVGRPPKANTARARQTAIAAILSGRRPKIAIPDALDRYDPTAYATIARAARRAKGERTKAR